MSVRHLHSPNYRSHGSGKVSRTSQNCDCLHVQWSMFLTNRSSPSHRCLNRHQCHITVTQSGDITTWNRSFSYVTVTFNVTISLCHDIRSTNENIPSVGASKIPQNPLPSHWSQQTRRLSHSQLLELRLFFPSLRITQLAL